VHHANVLEREILTLETGKDERVGEWNGTCNVDIELTESQRKPVYPRL
jgi:hypothetical protein